MISNKTLSKTIQELPSDTLEALLLLSRSPTSDDRRVSCESCQTLSSMLDELAPASPTTATTTKPIRLLDTSIPFNKSGRYISMVTQGKVLSGLMSLEDPYCRSTYSSDSRTSTRQESKPREEACASPASRRYSSQPRRLQNSGGANPESSTRTPTNCGDASQPCTTSPDQAGDSPILHSFKTRNNSIIWYPFHRRAPFQSHSSKHRKHNSSITASSKQNDSQFLNAHSSTRAPCSSFTITSNSQQQPLHSFHANTLLTTFSQAACASPSHSPILTHIPTLYKATNTSLLKRFISRPYA